MSESITIHPPEGFAGLRKAGLVAAASLDFIAPHVKPGVTTAHLDSLIEQFIHQQSAIPACIGYLGQNTWDRNLGLPGLGYAPGQPGAYQKCSCISVNHVVCHGIPDDKVLMDGDILNIDVTVIVDGYFGDTSRMFVAGDKTSVKGQKLMDATFEAMWRGIRTVKPGATLGDIGHAIQSYAEDQGFSVVRDFCGHGVGTVFHTEPAILHYGKPGAGITLQPGMVFTIEPMINAGRYETKILSDGWTAVTRDRSLSAQYEHTIGVTADGVEVFTLSPAGLHNPAAKNAT
ncbi:MAG: type I methionyl aminopeptidase [Bdellovibrionales bacterium]